MMFASAWSSSSARRSARHGARWNRRSPEGLWGRCYTPSRHANPILPVAILLSFRVSRNRRAPGAARLANATSGEARSRDATDRGRKAVPDAFRRTAQLLVFEPRIHEAELPAAGCDRRQFSCHSAELGTV